MTLKTEIVTSQRTKYFDNCEICDAEISGFSAKHVEINKKIHRLSHQNEGREK